MHTNQRHTNQGIQRQLSVPGTSEQNVVAERFNQKILDAIRSLLIVLGITNTLWADALDMTCQIRKNAMEGRIQEKMWTGKYVKLKHMRVYGCKAWTVLDKKQRGNFWAK